MCHRHGNISLGLYAIIFDANRMAYKAGGGANRANMFWIVPKDRDV